MLNRQHPTLHAENKQRQFSAMCKRQHRTHMHREEWPNTAQLAATDYRVLIHPPGACVRCAWQRGVHGKACECVHLKVHADVLGFLSQRPVQTMFSHSGRWEGCLQIGVQRGAWTIMVGVFPNLPVPLLVVRDWLGFPTSMAAPEPWRRKKSSKRLPQQPQCTLPAAPGARFLAK